MVTVASSGEDADLGEADFDEFEFDDEAFAEIQAVERGLLQPKQATHSAATRAGASGSRQASVAAGPSRTTRAATAVQEDVKPVLSTEDALRGTRIRARSPVKTTVMGVKRKVEVIDLASSSEGD